MEVKKLRNSLLLLLTATIWGVAFVFQSKGADVMRPFTFNCLRFFIGGMSLLVLIAAQSIIKKKEQKSNKKPSKTLIIGGVLCGILMFVATNFQQFGIEQTTVGKAGFITAFYIVLVPLLGIFIKKKCGIRAWISVAIALVGLYFLCIKDDFSIEIGDFLILMCALAFSVHILVVDHYAPLCDGVRLSCIQFFVSATLSGVCMLFFENDCMVQAFSALGGWDAWQALIVTGIFSCGVAYTLQIIGQKNMDPTIASLILSLESVMSALAGWFFLGQSLLPKEMIGCALMFCAIIMAQVSPKAIIDRIKGRKNSETENL